MSAKATDHPDQQQPLAMSTSSWQKNILAIALIVAAFSLAGLLFWYIKENGEQAGTRLASNGQPASFATLSLPGMEEKSLRVQASMENYLERRAQTVLDRLLGAGRSVVRVTVVMDPEESETTKETFDPEESVVRSEQLLRNQAADPVSALGNTVLGRINATGDRNQEVVNYEIGKTVSRTIKPSTTVRRLSASVLVDDATIRTLPVWILQETEEETDPANDHKPQGLAAVKALTVAALGLNMGRGDTIEIVALPLLPREDKIVTPLPSDWPMPSRPQIVLLLFCLLLVTLVLGQIMASRRRAAEKQVASQEEPLLQRDELTGLSSSTEEVLAQIQFSLRKDPLFGAHVLKTWLNGQL